MEVPRGTVSHPRNKYMFRYCVGTSGLCRKFRSNVPTGSGEMLRTACMFRLTVGTSDPCRKFRCGSSQGLCECSDSQLHVPTHCQKFRAWELKFEFYKSFWTCRKIRHTIGRSDRVAENSPTASFWGLGIYTLSPPHLFAADLTREQTPSNHSFPLSKLPPCTFLLRFG